MIKNKIDKNMIFAIYENEKFIFYNNLLEEIPEKEINNKKLYLILPDEWFFFFLTDIPFSRKASKILKAYAKTTFYLEDEKVNFLKNTNPLVGYIFKGDAQKIEKFLNKAKIVTTFFTIAFFSKKKPFVFINNSIVSFCDEENLLYFKGSYEDLQKRIDLKKDIEILDLSKKEAKKELILNFYKLIKDKKDNQLVLYIYEYNPYEILENFLKPVLVSFIALILVFLGGFLKYKSYQLQEKNIEQEIEHVYKKVFKNKNYQDPYGMLLYLVDKYKRSKDQSLDPINIIYILTKSKTDDSLIIDMISLDEDNIKIKGKIKDYKKLINFISALKKNSKLNVQIEDTNKKNNLLNFIISIHEA